MTKTPALAIALGAVVALVSILALHSCSSPVASEHIGASYPTPTGYGVPVVTNGHYNAAAAAGTAGQTLQWDGGADGSPGWAAFGWTTALDISFPAQSTQSLASNGVYTVAGNANWRKIISNDQVATALTSGTGLVFQPVSSSDINGGTFNAPLFGVQLASIIPGYYPGMPLRVWGYISSSNIAVQYDNAIIGAMAYNGGANTANVQVSKYGFTPVSGQAGASLEFESVGFAQHYYDITNGTGVPTATDNVVMVEYPMGLTHFSASTYTSSWSSGWPAAPSLRGRATLNAANGGASSPGFGGQAPSSVDAGNLLDASAYYAILGAMRAGSTTALNVTWSQFRVDYRP